MADEPDIAEVVRLFYAGWNEGSIDFQTLVAEDIVNHQPEVEPERGRGGVRPGSDRCHAARFPIRSG